MKTAAEIIKEQRWAVLSGSVVSTEERHGLVTVARMNRERMQGGHGDYIRPPHETDALTYLLGAAPELFEALHNLAEAVDHGEIEIRFTGQSKGKPSKLNKKGDLANIDSARKALALAQAWDNI